MSEEQPPTYPATRIRRVHIIAADGGAMFSTNMAPFARRAAERSAYARWARFLLYLPFEAFMAVWRSFVAVSYWLISRTTRMSYRGMMPSEDEYEYRLEYVALVAARVWRYAVGAVFAALVLFGAYLYVDARYLHWHIVSLVVLDPTMSNATAAVRDAMPLGHTLAFYGESNESELCLPRVARFQAQAIASQISLCDWRTMLAKSLAFMQANREHEHCCCGPMFGYDVNYVAFEAIFADDATSRRDLLRLFNVHDSAYELYDRLDVAQARLVGDENDTTAVALGAMRVVRHSQAALFAWPPEPATVSVLRRRVVPVHAMTIDGETHEFEFSDEQAYCLAECYDLMMGVSVYERARRQAARGIEL